MSKPLPLLSRLAMLAGPLALASLLTACGGDHTSSPTAPGTGTTPGTTPGNEQPGSAPAPQMRCAP
ncbi:hypothetical protein [Chitinasiproducens palmae]|uniref:Uncharacterized protein n=1 Tax=Chitinasiproducens palmae TaxID=1770053 RepID=A0A1H2PSV2_9BURK|nr:hypothetical protein [Chitinasiproducens palmae]SDV50126.1 hypothetical protein SAMN05216551_110140 [Chitinasiproducens palmae]